MSVVAAADAVGERPPSARDDVEGGAGDRVARATATISGLTLLSRVTGFLRMFVLVAVVGPTALGNAYQTSNSIPNLLFELFAAGALQAVLVPELVQVVERRGREEGRRVAGLVLGALLAVLGAAAVVGMALAPLLARALFAGAEDAVRADQVWLGTVFLWVFLPQVLFYAAGMVATAALNADDRFAVPAFAPILNNLVVIAAYLGFGALRHGDPLTLHLSVAEVAVLAGGTTLGVVAFTSAPVVAAARLGLVPRPRLAPRDPELRRLARTGLWAGGFLALTQVLLVAALVLGNTVDGGAVIYQLGYTYFLLPHALIAIPVFTALYPSLSRAAHRRDDGAYAALVHRGVQAVWVLALPATAGLVALATPVARLTLFGESAGSVDPVAAAMAAFAPGLAPYGLFLLLTRASYARGDARTPTMVHLAAAAVGLAGMVAATVLLHGDARIAGLAGAHSLAYVVAAVALAVALGRHVAAGRLADVRTLAGAAAAALAATGVMVAVRAAGLGGGGRVGALVQVAVGGAGALAVYLVGLRLTGIGDPRRLLRGDPEAGDA